MLRHSPGPSGGRQSRTKWPALSSSAARTDSAARNSSTLTGLVPSGTVVTRSMRYSMGFSFRSPGFSPFCHRLLRDLCDIHASPTRPHLEVQNFKESLEIRWNLICFELYFSHDQHEIWN